MECNWTVYMTQLEDVPALVMVDTLADEESSDALEEIAVIGIAMPSPDDDGLPSDEDCAWLDKFEEWLEKNARRLNGRYVGRIATGGGFQLHFYCRSVADIADAIKSAASKTLGCGIELRGGEDPEWSLFHEVLLPDEAEQQQCNVMSVLQQLVDAGDDLSIPREVDFTIRFPDTESRQAATKEIAALGYKVQEPDDADADDSEEFPWMLTFSVVIAPEPAELIERCIALVELAQKFDGDFDGFGCVTANDAQGDDDE
jgi:regulator of RNase E activity RraB